MRLPSVWNPSFHEYGEVPNQSPGFVLSAISAHDNNFRVLEIGTVLTAFKVQGQIASCFLEGSGFLRTSSSTFNMNHTLTTIKGELGVAVLYFPLLYSDLRDVDALLQTKGAIVLARRPSPIIDWSDNGALLWGRCVERLGSQATRRLKRFDTHGLTIENLTVCDAIVAIDHIERCSWKASHSQDMHSRGQFPYYRRLVENDSVRVRGVRHNTSIVAYRMDAQVRNVVFCLKWSYAEVSRKFSPGFALIARDLTHCYGMEHLKFIDLYGSPDLLKETVATRCRPRFDLAWPDCILARTLLAEREHHDVSGRTVYASRKGVRAAFNPVNL